MLEISTDHACDAVGQHTPIGLPSPQSLLLSSTIDGTGRCSHDLPAGTRHQIAIEPAAAAYSPFRDFVPCRFADAGRRWVWLRHPRHRHPQTFTEGDHAAGILPPVCGHNTMAVGVRGRRGLCYI